MNDDMKNENNQERKEKEGAAAPLQKSVYFVAAAAERQPMIKYFCDYCGKQLQEREGLKIRVLFLLSDPL